MKWFIFMILSGGMLIMLACSSNPPSNIGPKDNILAPCPDTPNCVSSTATDKEHAVAPLTYSGERKQAKQQLVTLIQEMKRTKIITNHDNYLHAEFTSALFRFIDDVEFYFPDNEKVIHLRSASRAGYSDLGVNRKRVETIRKAFEKAEE